MNSKLNVDVVAEVTGSVWKIEVSEGDAVKPGDLLAILESMKMEIPTTCSESGHVREIRVQEGESVAEGDVLMVIETEEAENV